ncbi:MAG: DinB family protein [Owenweeksia sp.]|nr:DinB family protein [Owenweeksia sp.]
MKIFAPFLILLTFGASNCLAQDNPISAFQLKWQNSKNYLIEMAESMPAKQYNYGPTERQMTFREQLLHIRRNMLWLSQVVISGKEFENTDTAALSKQETIGLLASAFDKVSETVAKMDANDLSEKVEFKGGTKTKLQILNLIQDHVTHHRGQLVVYLNLQGIDPPGYVGW